MLRTAYRNVLAHRFRAAATAVAVALGVSFLSGTLVLSDTVRHALESSLAQSYAGTDAYVRADASFGAMGEQRPRLDAALVDQVAAVPGVAQAEGRVEGYAQLLDKDGDPVREPDDSFGANWSVLRGANPFRLVEGRPPQADAEAVIDRASAKATGYRVGDTARVATHAGPVDVAVVGVAAFGAVDSPAGASYVLMTQSAAARLVGQTGRVDGISVVGDKGLAQADVRDRVAAALGGGVDVVTTDALVAERHGGVTADVSAVVRMLLPAFAAVAMFVAAFIIHNTFSILVAQRTKELALARAVGATRRQIAQAVMLEAAVLGAVGASAGAVGGVVAALALAGVVDGFGVDVPSGSLVVRAASLAGPALLGTVVTVVSAVSPARRAGSVPPVAALRDAALGAPPASRRRTVLGAVLLSVGTVLVLGPLATGGAEPAVTGLGAAIVFVAMAAFAPRLAPPAVRLIGRPLARTAGVPAVLARESAARNSRRTAGAASALMIGTGLVTLIGVFAASAKATASGPPPGSGRTPDFVVLSAMPESGGFSPRLAQRLATLPEVAQATAGRATMVQVGGDPAVHLHTADTPLRDDQVSVLRAMADMRGWRVGSVIAIRFPDVGERQFQVGALHASGPPYLVSLRAYEANVVDQLDMSVLVTKADGVPRDRAEAAVKAVLRDFPAATLLDKRGKSKEQLASIDRFLNAVYVLLALATLISLIGIGTTLALSVAERSRELGLLRAVGMTPQQVRAMIRWESLLIALFGCGLGVGAGLAFGWGILHGLPDDVAFRVPAVHLTVMTVAACGAALMAAAGPARRAAQGGIVAALARD